MEGCISVQTDDALETDDQLFDLVFSEEFDETKIKDFFQEKIISKTSLLSILSAVKNNLHNTDKLINLLIPYLIKFSINCTELIGLMRVACVCFFCRDISNDNLLDWLLANEENVEHEFYFMSKILATELIENDSNCFDSNSRIKFIYNILLENDSIFSHLTP